MNTGATELEEAVVTANQGDVINKERTGAELTIDSKQLKALPTISRSSADYYRLTPMASGNSIAGRNDQFNNFTLTVLFLIIHSDWMPLLLVGKQMRSLSRSMRLSKYKWPLRF